MVLATACLQLAAAPPDSSRPIDPRLTDRLPRDIRPVTLLCAPEGIEFMERDLAELEIPITLVTGSIDERLNEQGLIVPGLGDAGDRLYGVAD